MSSRPTIPASGPSDRRAPRYDGYPTTAHFTDTLDADAHARWLGDVAAGPASIYVHIPFCRALCWFCTCRTQTGGGIARYLAHLSREIARVGARLPADAAFARMHWGGGSPSILTPGQITALLVRLRRAFAITPDAQFTIEIDPRDITDARLDALAAGGLTRGAITVIDHDAPVRRAINRAEDWLETRRAASGLRARGAAIDIDALYGLPNQTEAGLCETLTRALDLAPDRVALSGYVHAPWVARRQRAIAAATLPDPGARAAQAAIAREILALAGYLPVGIDHFARPGDALAEAAVAGTLRRGFQGYVADRSATQIGLGASAISRLPAGYAQNAGNTGRYLAAIAAGGLATTRSKALSLDDRIRGHAIERLICTFAFDAADMTARFGDFARPCLDIAQGLLAGEDRVWLSPMGPGGFRIKPEARAWTRLIASRFDAYLPAGDARLPPLV